MDPAATSPEPSPDGEQHAPAAELAVGSRVRLKDTPAYLKTADAMPMLRPPELVDGGEVGQVVALKALGQVAVRFRRGTFLLEGRQLELISETP
jgi:hypothetical protein